MIEFEFVFHEFLSYKTKFPPFFAEFCHLVQINTFLNTLTPQQHDTLMQLYHDDLLSHIQSLSPEELSFIEDFNTALINACEIALIYPHIRQKEFTFDWCVEAFKSNSEGRWNAVKGCANIKKMILQSNRIEEFQVVFKCYIKNIRAKTGKNVLFKGFNLSKGN